MNKVVLYNIESDIPPEKTLVDYNQSSTSDIQVSSVGIFTSFENLGISSDNPGYIKINNEIIRYTGINTSTNSLSGITRGIDTPGVGLNIESIYSINYHPAGSPVFKYEFNGISLRRINRSHSFSDVDINKYPIGIDSYHVKILTEERGRDRKFGSPKLFFNESKTGGTYDINFASAGTNSLSGPKATQNVAFDILRPNVQMLLPETTNIDAKVRTLSSTSASGNELSFRTSEYTPISLNSNNTFSTERMIASKINELNNVSTTLGNKSFVMELTLSTKDTKVSPLIDLDRVNIITSMNRINKPITNYITDGRVNTLYDDPNAAIYVSKIIRLQKNADSLKVYFDAYRDSSNEIIVLYRLLRSDVPDNQQLFELFPGYDNLDSNLEIIDPRNNSGLPDTFVSPSSSPSDMRSYEYTAKYLPLFNGFQIKIIMTGTNQAIVPRIKDLRAIAVF
jgi:hypothetical protein